MSAARANNPTADALARLREEIVACTLCAQHLPLGPGPLVHGHVGARVLIISQAPGTKAHVTRQSFNDRSGDMLRDWLGVDRNTFYDEDCFALMPMGFCYPGREAAGGDCPPRPECAPRWHARVRALLPAVGLTLLIGSYAIAHYLGPRARPTVRETVRAWAEYTPAFFPLPHPSWRTLAWQRHNPWFASETLPALRARLAPLIVKNEATMTPRVGTGARP